MTEGTAATTVVVATDAGMLALWSGAAFETVNNYDDWEARVNERLDDAIARGEIVPVGIQGDGAFAVRVATAPSGLSDREQRFTVVTSDPYLLSTPGGQTFLTGVESVGNRDNAPLAFALAPGRYAVRVTLVAWDDEPGAKDDDGNPTPIALPDFVVQISPETGAETYRIDAATFDPLS